MLRSGPTSALNVLTFDWLKLRISNAPLQKAEELYAFVASIDGVMDT